MPEQLPPPDLNTRVDLPQPEVYVQNPANPEHAPRVDTLTAHNIGNSMLQGAADAVKSASAARVAQQQEQLQRPLAPDAITEVPSFSNRLRDLESAQDELFLKNPDYSLLMTYYANASVERRNAQKNGNEEEANRLKGKIESILDQIPDNAREDANRVKDLMFQIDDFKSENYN